MITTSNYYNQINSIGVNHLPPALVKSHELVNKITQDGTSWETYNANATIKRVVDLYLEKLNQYEAENAPKKTKQEAARPAKKVQEKKIPAKTEKKTKATKKKEDNATEVEHIEDELKFIKRFVLMDGKIKSPGQILSFLDAVQKAIIERRIRKTSPYAAEIKIIQEKLVHLYNHMNGNTHVHLKPETMQKMIGLVKSEKVMPSITFIKRYVRLQGKLNMSEKAKKLLKDMEKAVKNGVLTKADKYADKVNVMYKSLQNLITKPKEHDALDISTHELNGLNAILNDCGCNGLNGVDEDENEQKETAPAPKGNRIMNSQDFAEMKFNSIGFKEKWLDFIGDPSKGFTAMVFGRPKMGKSYLCMDFAGYLARNHGKVLYVAKEEKLDATLQKKLSDLHVQHPNLFVSDDLPASLTGYDFVFIDSVNKMELQPADLDQLKANNPGVSFIYVFQTTKGGAFRGSNHFQHDVDVVIEVPEKGIATQNGRFNQGGEMQIFDNAAGEKQELNGVKKKKTLKIPDWTEPKHLNESDWQSLKTIKKHYDKGEYAEAMNYAMYDADTAVREEIPPNVWQDIGGNLTATGQERLRKLIAKYGGKR
jgi:hypothetical protein